MIKRFLCAAAALALLGAPVSAQDAPSDTAVPDGQFCSVLGQLAESMMGAWQRGASADQMLAAAQNAGENIRPITMAMATDAIQAPQFSDAADRERAVAEFRSGIMETCQDAMNANANGSAEPQPPEETDQQTADAPAEESAQ